MSRDTTALLIWRGVPFMLVTKALCELKVGELFGEDKARSLLQSR